MFERIENGTGLIKGAIGAILKYPRMLVPMLICWLVYAPVLIGLKFFVPWEAFSFGEQVGIVFCSILLFSIMLSWSAFVLLELIRQIEMNEHKNLPRALGKSLPNVTTALPIAIAWALIWFVLAILESVLRRGSEDGEESFSSEGAAETLAGWDEGSLSTAILGVLQKGVRMVAFIIYPAIAWERLGVVDSVKKGLRIARLHRVELATGFVLTELAAIAVFLPPAVLFLLSGKFGIDFSDWVWFVAILYCGLAWSFSLFLEQMFVAELYLWHMFWEREAKEARLKGATEPKLTDVKRPTVMDNVADLLLTGLVRSGRAGVSHEDSRNRT